MAKRKLNPETEDTVDYIDASGRNTDRESGIPVVGKVEGDDCVVTIPSGHHDENGYQSRVRVHDQIHCTSMSIRQRTAMAHLYGALRRDNVEMNRRPIVHQNDTIRWLLERVADAYGID